jgi:hypothetical protein
MPRTPDSPEPRRLRSSRPEPLDPSTRGRLEHGFGARVDHLVVHRDSAAQSEVASESARAFSYGDALAFGAGQYRPGTLNGDLLLAHEAAHALARGGGSEEDADRASIRAVLRMRGISAPPGSLSLASGTGGLALRRCGPGATSTGLQRAMNGSIPWTADLAREALTNYRGMGESDRQSAFERTYRSGALSRLLSAIPANELSGTFNSEVQDLLQRVQRTETLRSAAASGLADEAAMARTQADLMIARNTAAAAAASTSASPPTAAEVAAQQSSQVASTSIAPSSSTLTPAEISSWTTRANAAVTAVVNYATTNHPELGLTAADFHVDIEGVENRGAGVIAYGEQVGGRDVATVGRTFVRFVEANPAYALSVVVHELHGHPEYGPYGGAGVEYGLSVYDRAAALMPGYTQPTGAGRTSEIDAYAYQETEIYSLLRSLPYHTTLASSDAALQPNYVDPEPTVTARIGIIKGQFEPRVAKALLRGLYRRLLIDPRITGSALLAFRRAVYANYTGAESTTADDIVR